MRRATRTYTGLTSWASAHPLAVDVAFAAVIGSITLVSHLATEPSGSERSADALGVALVLTQTVALAFRRVRPLAALVAVTIPTLTFWVRDYATSFDVFSLLAVYSATANGGRDRARVWRVVGTTVALLSGIAILGVLYPGEDLPAAAVLGITAVHLTAAITGEIVHDRRRRVAALERRARRAEAERELLARQAVSDERARIARDLHDIVAHAMSVMVVQAGAAQRVVDTDPERARQALANIQQTGREALSEMRRMLGVLRYDTDAGTPVDRAPQPTMADLDQIVRHAVESGVETELIVHGESTVHSAGQSMTGYRIVQEALTNVIKHAGRPARAVVRITYTDDVMRVEVTDDGRGSSTEQVERSLGHGLVGMRERVDLYGGTLRAGPRPGGGFRVAATIPLEAARSLV